MESLIIIGFFVFFLSILAFGIGSAVKSKFDETEKNKKNDSLPISEKSVKITSRRTYVSGGGKFNAHTTYYATFEIVETKERLEFQIPSDKYGLMSENDLGELTFQGTRFHNFQRTLQ
jgi:Protein of unknown function (DUF2500)